MRWRSLSVRRKPNERTNSLEMLGFILQPNLQATGSIFLWSTPTDVGMLKGTYAKIYST
jgi:hypothetical protein